MSERVGFWHHLPSIPNQQHPQLAVVVIEVAREPTPEHRWRQQHHCAGAPLTAAVSGSDMSLLRVRCKTALPIGEMPGSRIGMVLAALVTKKLTANSTSPIREILGGFRCRESQVRRTLPGSSPRDPQVSRSKGRVPKHSYSAPADTLNFVPYTPQNNFCLTDCRGKQANSLIELRRQCLQRFQRCTELDC
jgi:hypothetical protein